MRWSLVLVAAVLLAGCATTPPSSVQESAPAPAPAPPARAAPPPVNLSGYPREFREGHADGCASARGTARTRSEVRFKAEPSYAQGWRDGYDICRARGGG